MGSARRRLNSIQYQRARSLLGLYFCRYSSRVAELRHGDCFLHRFGNRRQADGDVSFLKRGDRVLVRRAGIGVVRFAVDQMEPDGISAGRADNRFFGDGDLGSAGNADVGVKNVFPDGRAGCAGYIFHVEHMVPEAFIKNVRLDLKGNLRGSQLVLQARPGQPLTAVQ